jgi:hypothetical protein
VFGNRWRHRGIETYKQEIQLIQVARIWEAGRGASIDAGAFGLAARWVRRWVHWSVHWCEHCNGSWIVWFILWLLALEGHYGWRNLIRTRGHPLLVARLWIETEKYVQFPWTDFVLRSLNSPGRFYCFLQWKCMESVMFVYYMYAPSCVNWFFMTPSIATKFQYIKSL